MSSTTTGSRSVRWCVRECVRVCVGMQGCARVCAGVHSVGGCALVCVEVRGCLRVCVWDEFSEYLLENRVPTSADFNTYLIQILVQSLYVLDKILDN